MEPAISLLKLSRPPLIIVADTNDDTEKNVLQPPTTMVEKTPMSAFARTKTCTKCDVKKSQDDFRKLKSGGYRAACKACESEAHRLYMQQSPEQRAKLSEYAKRWREENSDHVVKYREENAAHRKLQRRVYHLYAQYGITPEQYDALLVQQDFACAICREAATEENTKHGLLAVDHDHSTGMVRGLLCDLCNRGIGNFADDVTRLSSAIEYLKGGAQ